MGWDGLVERIGERTGAYRVLLGKPAGKKPFKGLGVNGRLTF
jgi:hypothetical protein